MQHVVKCQRLNSFSVVLLLAGLWFSLSGRSFATPLHQQLTRSTTASRHLRNQLMTMRTSVDEALTDYIAEEMECTNIEACRTYMTSLRLTTLPTVTDIKRNSEWSAVMEKNMNGLQDFNYYLQSVFATLSGSASEVTGHELFGSTSDQMRDVSNMLLQFMIGFEDYIETTYCRSLNVRALNAYPPCEICRQPALPSRAVELARNYHFLMQFYDYLHDFGNVYNKFLYLAPVPAQC